MKQITLNIPEKKYPFFMELVNNLSFVKKVEVENDEPTKKQILEGIKEAVKEVNLIKAGKIKAVSLNDFLNEP